MLALVLYGAVYALLVPMPNPRVAAPTEIYAANGSLVTPDFPGTTTPVPYNALPQSLKAAIVATEDRTFWTNFGFDPASIARALLVDVMHGRIVEGGSTLTQQLAKNLFLTQSRTVGRKFLEFFLTLRLAAAYTKPQILDLYFNNVYFGEGAWGVSQAATTYFGAKVRNLTLSQSALLAGLVAAPSAYDPYLHPQRALERRKMVLERMMVMGDISKSEAQRAASAPLGLSGRPQVSAGVAPYFVQFVLSEIRATDPSLAEALLRGGYRVYTTLNPNAQEAADGAFRDHLPPDGPGPEGALVALDPQTGAVEAMVGGRSYAKDPYNRAANALRQPGSTFKPIMYAALLSTGKYTAASVMDDAPVSFPGATPSSPRYSPKNYENTYYGPMIIRRALMISDNVVAVKWLYVLGIDPVIRLARALGITTPLTDNLTLTLGSSPVTPLEMAQAFSAFANGGDSVRPYAVTEVIDPRGQVVFHQSPHRARALSQQVAFILTNLLTSVFSPGGTGAGLSDNLDFEVAGKTGTSQQNDDGWFVGYSSNLVAACWVGYDRAKPLPGPGATVAGPIWSDFMARAEDSAPPPDFVPPPGVVEEPISTLDGEISDGNSPTSMEWFIDGTQPTQVSPIPYDWSQPNALWPNATTWYYSYHGPNPSEPKWNLMMGFTKSGSQAQK